MKTVSKFSSVTLETEIIRFHKTETTEDVEGLA